MGENIRTYCKTALNRFYTTKIWMVALCLFLINLLGYTAFRYYISDDLFGSDVINFTRNTNSYFLKWKDIANPGDFLSSILSGKKKDPNSGPNAFVWSLLSDNGKHAAERLYSGKDIKWDKDLFILEFNKSLVDEYVDWPKQFFPDAKDICTQKIDISNRECNIRILAKLFPQISYPGYMDKVSLQSLADQIWKYIPHLFTLEQPTRYSPLSNLYTITLRNYLVNSPERIIIAIIFKALFYALLMTLVYFLAMEVFSSIPWALFSTILFQTSVSAIISVYPIFTLPYLFVPLTMIAAFLSYLKYKNSGKVFYFILFILFAIAGPWVREFSGLIPFIVLANEALNFKGRRSIAIIAACMLLAVHSIYPSLFTWLIGLNKGSFFGVYSQDKLHHLKTSQVNWMSPGMVFVELPPIMWMTALVSIGFWIWRSNITAVIDRLSVMRLRVNTGFLSLPRVHKFLKATTVIIIFLVAVAVVYFFFGNYRDQDWQFPGEGFAVGAPVLAVILIVTLFSLRFNTLIPIYFMAVFLPFMRIGGNTEVHMSFALAPLSIMLILWIRELYRMFSLHLKGVVKRISLICLSLFFVLGMADQILNIYACASSQKAVVKTNKEIADFIKKNFKRHSIVVCNFFNFVDIFYYSGYYFDPYETVENSPMPPKVVHKNKDFENLVNKNFGVRDIYLLAEEHEYFEYQKNYHTHKYVKNPPGEIEELKSFRVKNVYYYTDPLKFFIMRRFQSIPLYMDWSIDFYYNNLSMFRRIVDANYTLYKLKDISKGFAYADNVPQTQSQSQPHLAGSYQGYNIVDYRGQFYGVPQSLGPLDLSKEEDRKHKEIVVSKDRKEIEKLIDKAIQSRPKIQPKAQPKVKAVYQPPHLAGSYQGYNIVDYRGQFYGVPQSLGPLDLSKEEDRKHKEIVVSKDRKEIEKLIDKAIQSRPKIQPKITAVDYSPRLVRSYKGYNIVEYNNRFYGVPQSLGTLDLRKEEDRNRDGILVGKDIKEIKTLIKKHLGLFRSLHWKLKANHHSS